MSAAAIFQQTLGAEIAEILGPKYKFFKSSGQLRAEVDGGHHVVALAGSNKNSPYVEVAFYLGKNFAAAKRVEKQLDIFHFYYHVQQYSPNCACSGSGAYHGPCTWSVDISRPPPMLAKEVANAIGGLSTPFLEKYGTMLAARDAIANNDLDVFSGKGYWAQLLRLDLALGDLQHFERWAIQLDDLTRSQASEVIQKWQVLQK